MTGRTVTIQTVDHGPVTVQCPDWCTGDGHPDGSLRGDISHRGEPVTIAVATPLGPMELMELQLTQHSFTALPIGTASHVTLHFALADGWPTDPDDFEQLADRITDAVTEARGEVRRLHGRARGGGQPAEAPALSTAELPPAAVALLTSIRDHLDIPLYRERSKQDRRAFRELLEIRHADVVHTLNVLLAVPEADALDYAAQLRAFAVETPVRYRTTDQANGG